MSINNPQQVEDRHAEQPTESRVPITTSNHLGGSQHGSTTTLNQKNEQSLQHVCVECGQLSKIVRHLQNENYCLERCKRCGEVADKYGEYDSNLKILSVLLCLTQIYRHIFFNVETIKNLKVKCYMITFFLLFLFYLHESKVNYRKYLEAQFISEVRDLTLRDFTKNKRMNTTSSQDLLSLNVTECVNRVSNSSSCMDFYKLSSILQEALKNIDEEKLYTKHIFDRFDSEALITAVVRAASYIASIIGQTYFFKLIQMNFYNRQSKS